MTSRPMRDWAVLGSGYALLVLGLLAWWAVSPGPGETDVRASLLAVWLAAAVLVAATWWLNRAAADTSLAAAFGLAAAAPLTVVPMVGGGDVWAIRLGLAIAAIAVLPLAWEFSGFTRSLIARRTARATTVAGAAAAVAIGWVATGSAATWPTDALLAPALWWIMVTTAVAVPVAFAAAATMQVSRGTRRAGIVDVLRLGAVGVAVAVAGIALLVPWWPTLVGPILVVVGTVLFLGRVAIRPLEAEAGAAITQRDLIVAASETERLRMVSALHDGPLGDLALLVQRLDVAGDTDNASLTRLIAADLRALGNDLRVPILDDLGAGPAIEWLTARVAERAQTRIQLELDARMRPPADVELAAYRIAQEALSNAVKHGRGPVRIAYSAQPDAMSLSVADSGPGLDQGAPARALREGRLGVLLMRQRAEAIGATLVFSTPDGGGTRVGLTWAATSA